jgi:hypothetical protein
MVLKRGQGGTAFEILSYFLVPRKDRKNLDMMVWREVPNPRILMDKLLKLILFYLTIALKLEFSRSHQILALRV